MKTESGQAFVVDDETNLRESLAELIAGEGLRVAQAGDGQEAIESLRSGAVTPDVIFLDTRMTRMNGLEVLRKIQDEELTTAPVIIINAYGDNSKMIEAMRHDKKVVAGQLHFVLPTGIGGTSIVNDVTEKEIKAALQRLGFKK